MPGYLLSSFENWDDVARSYVQRARPKSAVIMMYAAVGAPMDDRRAPESIRARLYQSFFPVSSSTARSIPG